MSFSHWKMDSSRAMVTHYAPTTPHVVQLISGGVPTEEMIDFINSETTGLFYLGFSGVSFQNEKDALMFKLRYGK